jgi:hypothetical protein
MPNRGKQVLLLEVFMRALLVSSVLLLAQLSYGQDQAAAPAAPATPAAAEETPAVTIPNAWKEGIFVSPSFSMFKRKVEQTGTTPGVNGDVTGMNLDVKGAYTFNFGLFAGAQVSYNKGKDNSSGLDDMSTYSVGPMVGYHCSYTGLMLAATYHVLGKSKIDFSAGPDVTYDKVTGLQVDLSYPIQLTEKINVGPQFTWRRLELKEGDNSAADQKTKEFVPSISAWFYF